MRPTSESRSLRSGSTAAGLMLIALLIIPVSALVRLTPVVDYRIMVGWLTIVSLTTVQLYWLDKRSAEARRWRIPEATLHLFEALGGWPAAFIAQRLFRHKTVKLSYQFTFWLIVVIHQLVAMEVLLGGATFRRVLEMSMPSSAPLSPTASKPTENSPLPIVVPGSTGRTRVP